MMKMLRRTAIACLASLAAFAAAAEDEYPSRPITLIVPFAAGGQTDSLGRIVGEALGKELGQPVIIDNRAGAGGIAGTDAAARARPDGYTLVVGGPSTISTQPLLNSSVRYNVARDFAPIAMISAAPMLLVVNSKSPYRTLKDLIEAGRTKPLTYGSSGYGSSMHLGAEYLLITGKTNAVHVPFRGSSQSLPALVSGTIDFLIDPPITAMPLVEAGQLRALAVTTRTDDKSLAAIPTIAESGIPGYDQLIWNGILAPKNTPQPILDKLASALKAVTSNPDVASRLAKAGVPVLFKGPKDFATFINEDVERYRKIIEEAKIKLN